MPPSPTNSALRSREAKRALATLAGRLGDGSLKRRDFLRHCASLGLGFSAAALAGMAAPRPWPRFIGSAAAATPPDGDVSAWLNDVGGAFRGTTLRVVSETTPPTAVLKQLTRQQFTQLTGIEVQFELLPLERVLQRISIDVSSQTAHYDVYYLDQSWIARFADDTVDLREKDAQLPDLAMPGYDWDDLLPSLMQGIATYAGKTVGIPFDIPVFILFYRQDIFEELGLVVPATMDDYLAAVRTIQAAKAPAVYGTTGQMKAGHYCLNCEWTAWLWSHGGSIFAADGSFAGGDERGLEGLDYMLRLYDNMPPYADTWTWDGEAQSLLQGLAGLTLTWAELFPATDDPAQSLVPGLMGAAPPPRAKALRAPADCGYGEVPNIGHQGGSALALSRYSPYQDAAWVFLQWATSAEVQAQASLLGGGASPTRRSVFDDPRIAEAAQVQAGTTRHFDAVRRTIEGAMGSEPDLPVWPDLSNGVIPYELGRLLAAERRDPAATMKRIKVAVDRLAEPFRS